jgi:hypothetical protein
MREPAASPTFGAAPDVRFTPSPTAVGCWLIGSSLRIYVRRRPTWFHRWTHRLVFGWRWQDKAPTREPR